MSEDTEDHAMARMREACLMLDSAATELEKSELGQLQTAMVNQLGETATERDRANDAERRLKFCREARDGLRGVAADRRLEIDGLTKDVSKLNVTNIQLVADITQLEARNVELVAQVSELEALNVATTKQLGEALGKLNERAGEGAVDEPKAWCPECGAAMEVRSRANQATGGGRWYCGNSVQDHDERIMQDHQVWRRYGDCDFEGGEMFWDEAGNLWAEPYASTSHVKLDAKVMGPLKVPVLPEGKS